MQNIAGLIGTQANQNYKANISQKNYYVYDSRGANGVGIGPCADTVCIKAPGENSAERRAWLQDTLNEQQTLGWDGGIWGKLGESGSFPCLKNMPLDARSCP